MTFLMWVFTILVVAGAYVICAPVGAGKRSTDKTIVVTLVIAGFLLIGGWSWFSAWKKSPDREVEAVAKDCGNTTMAFVMSQNFVKQRLKSPSSAEFPMVTDRGVHVTPDGKCGFAVSAFVDSQNAFGAVVRSPYQAAITYNRQSKRWSLGALSIQ